VVNRPIHMNAYEFVVLAALRAQQLLAGCTPRLAGDHGVATMAQMEVAGGCISRDVVDVTPADAPVKPPA
jgi:DNA-directed RNA polymerase subunit K/omega